MATEEKTTDVQGLVPEGAPPDGNEEVEGQISAQLGIEIGDTPFSLELSQDQKDIRDWVHGFAEQTVARPRRVGRARGDALAGHPGGGEDRPLRLRGDRAVLGRPVRAHLPDRQRGAVLGRRRDRHGDHGHDAGGRRHLRQRHARADGRVDPAVLRRPRTTPRSAAFCVSEPDAGSDVSSLRTRAKYDEAKDEWVLNGQKAWATNGGIAERPRRRRLGRPRAEARAAMRRS